MLYFILFIEYSNTRNIITTRLHSLMLNVMRDHILKTNINKINLTFSSVYKCQKKIMKQTLFINNSNNFPYASCVL